MSPSTTTSQVMSTSDLRSHGVENKRDQEHRHKWQHGMKKGPGHCETAHGVPASAISVVSRMERKQENTFGRNKASKHTRAPYIVTHDDNVNPDSDDEYWDPNEPDAEITYSFDNPRGASQGSQVLGTALAKAVEKFEGLETDRIVHEEYEVLDEEGAEMDKMMTAKGKGRRKMKVAMPANSAAGLISPRDEIEYEFV